MRLGKTLSELNLRGIFLKDDFVIVSHELLSETAQRGVLDEFILREGTDYGHREWTIEEKRRALLRQLDDGRLQLVYNHKTQTCNLIENQPS